MKKIQMFLCGYGCLIGIFFSLAVYFVVDWSWTTGKLVVFMLSCISAGFLVGWVAFAVITQVLKHIVNFCKRTLRDQIHLEYFEQRPDTEDLLLSMKADFEALVRGFLEMKQNIEEKSIDLENKNDQLNKQNAEVVKKQHELLSTLQALTDSEKKFKSFFNTAIDAIYIMDKYGTILEVNQSTERTLGYLPGELTNKPFIDLLHPDIKEDFPKNLKILLKQGSKRTELRLLTNTNQTIFVDCSSSVIKDDTGNVQYIVAFQRDITQLKEKEKQIEYIAYHDVVTNLPNRRYGVEFLEMAIHRSKRTNNKIGVFFIDLDHFKYINDTFGHRTGDILLLQVANRLKENLRSGDIVVRLGGDEFMLVCDGVTNEETLSDVAEGILNKFVSPFLLQDQEQYITCSIGVALYPDHGDCAEVIIKNSDIAMYRAKEEGRDSFKLFNQRLHNEICTEMNVRQELIKAIEEQELFLKYQPIVDIVNGELVGIEVLARWQHPEKGELSPNLFIPIAEKYALISQIDKHIMQMALKEVETLGAENKISNLCFNISASEFHSQFVNLLAEMVSESTITHQQVTLEITESMMVNNNKIVHEVKKQGFKVSVDDFGAGHKSMNYLKGSPIDMIKIDRKFTSNIEQDEANQAIVMATIALADALEVFHVVEGVETEQQLDVLKKLGCRHFQGYYFSKPVSLKQLLENYSY